MVETFNNRPLADSQAIDDADAILDPNMDVIFEQLATYDDMVTRHICPTFAAGLQIKKNNMNICRTLLCRVWRCGCLVVSREDAWMFAQIKLKNTSVFLSSDYDHHQSHCNRRCHFHGDHPHHEKTCC